VKPYFTPADIDKGAKWASEISKELAASSVCIIILTRENLSSSWIMFESGAISSTLENARVCPIIFGMEPTDLQGPLAQFQITRFLKEDVRKLFKTINALAAENKLDEAVAESVFNKWWPDLEDGIKAVLDGHVAKPDSKKIRSDRELIEEILLLTRSQVEKEKLSPRVSTQYAGSLNEQFINVLKFVVDDTGFLNDRDLNKNLVNLYSMVEKRMAPTDMRDTMLVELTNLIERTSPPPRKAKRAPVAEMDDDIPF
jgi:hypothetical protein